MTSVRIWSLQPSSYYGYFLDLTSSEICRLSQSLRGSCLRMCLSVCVSVSQSVYLSVCPSVRLSVCPSVRLSVCPSVRLSVCPSVRLSVCPSVRLSVCPSVRLSVCPSVRLSVCPSVRLSVCPSVRLSVCPSVRLSVCPSVRLSVCQSVVQSFSKPAKHLAGLPSCLSTLACLSVCVSVCQSVCQLISQSASQSVCLPTCVSFFRSVGTPLCLLLAAQVSRDNLVKDECPTQRCLFLHWHDVFFHRKCIQHQQPPWNGFADLSPCRKFDKTRGDNSLRISHKELD